MSVIMYFIYEKPEEDLKKSQKKKSRKKKKAKEQN